MKYFETERLIVRNFKEEDAADLFAYLHNPRVNCFADMKLESINSAKASIKEKMNEKFQFAVCLKKNDHLIGDLFAMEEGDTYNVGWHFNAAYEGKGYASEATKGLFNFLFDQEKARRIYCYVEETNIRSQQLCERLGMRKEGLFLEYVSFIKNKDNMPHYENTSQYAILSKEWKKNNGGTE